MYFDFEDHRPETPILERPLTRLEQILLTIIAYLLIVIGLIVYPRLPFVRAMEAARLKAVEEQRLKEAAQHQNVTFAFAQPKLPQQAPKQPKFLSDETHKAQTLERAPNPKNDMPFSRGNTPQPIIDPPRHPERASPAPQASPTPTPPAADPVMPLPMTPDATIARNTDRSNNPTLQHSPSPNVLADAIRNVQKYSQGETLQNVQGSGDFGPSFQFDAKGVDFGSWLRRFRAQVYRNWLIPYAAMSLHGHTVMRFTIRKDGTILDLQILQPSSIEAFTSAAANAIKASNPTIPLPPEYPDDQMVMTVIFYYNESPPGGGTW
jgi:TonB family protein